MLVPTIVANPMDAKPGDLVTKDSMTDLITECEAQQPGYCHIGLGTMDWMVRVSFGNIGDGLFTCTSLIVRYYVEPYYICIDPIKTPPWLCVQVEAEAGEVEGDKPAKALRLRSSKALGILLSLYKPWVTPAKTLHTELEIEEVDRLIRELQERWSSPIGVSDGLTIYDGSVVKKGEISHGNVR